MPNNKLMSYYTKSLLKRYIDEQDYLQDLFIQLKTFIVFWFDKELDVDIQYLEYKGDGIIECYSERELLKAEEAVIFLELNLEHQYHSKVHDVFLYGWKWCESYG